MRNAQSQKGKHLATIHTLHFLYGMNEFSYNNKNMASDAFVNINQDWCLFSR